MARLSRNARGKARKKRTISLQNREIRQLKAAFFNTHQMLLMVLGQSGGEVTVTQGTMQQILQQGPKVNWQTAPGANEHEFIVRLVVQEIPDVEGATTDVLPAAVSPDAAAPSGPTSISELARQEAEGEDSRLDINPQVAEGAD